MTSVAESTRATTKRLTGKVAVVTGASSGIGEATARALADLGASVVIAARNGDRCEQVAADIRAHGGIASAIATDTTRAADLERMVQTAVDTYGQLHYAVNNAGTSGRGRFIDLGVDDFDRVIDTNLRGVFLAMQAEIPALLGSSGAAIVNTASVGGLVGVPGLSSYVASKWGVIGLTKSVALEYVTEDLRINAIAPGGTATAMFNSGTQEQRDQLARLAPMQRVADPVEIARGIVYLLADATYSTGIVLAADGGQSVP